MSETIRWLAWCAIALTPHVVIGCGNHDDPCGSPPAPPVRTCGQALSECHVDCTSIDEPNLRCVSDELGPCIEAFDGGTPDAGSDAGADAGAQDSGALPADAAAREE